MAEFKSFTDIGKAFQSGMQALGRPGASYVPAYRSVMAYDSALHSVGQRFVDHFRHKFDEGGPGWAPLAYGTQVWRDKISDGLPAYTKRKRYRNSMYAHHGGASDYNPLSFSNQLRDALTYEVDPTTAGAGAVQVGYDNKIHMYSSSMGQGYSHPITMEELAETKEVGTHTEPPRPIMFGEDYNRIENAIVEEFAERALFGNLVHRVRD